MAVTLVITGSAAHAENWRVVPKIAVNETLTNNVGLTSQNARSDLVTDIAPGISIDGKGARASLRLDYTLTQHLYARDSSFNNRQNSLVAVGALEAIEDWLFVDATGTISQQYISPLGAVSPSTANVNTNQTETAYYSLSPYIRGRLFSTMDYLLRYRGATTNSDGSAGAASDQTTREWTGRIAGSTRWDFLRWSVDASDLHTDYQSGRDTQSKRYGVTLAYRWTPQVQFSATAGRESSDYVTLQKEWHTTSGYGVEWTPTPRTRLAASKNKRFFGNGYDVAFSHRMARALLTYGAGRDVSFQPPGVTNTGQGSNYDALYAIVAASNPGMAPDAIKVLVTQALQARGLPADGTVVNGYLNSSPTVQTRQGASLALLGIRNTVTVTWTDSKHRALAAGSAAPNVASLSNETHQRGFGLGWGHQLTGLSSLSMQLSQQRSSTVAAGSPETKTESAHLVFTTRLGAKTGATLGVRRVISSGIAGYTESALTGALTHSF